MDGANIFNFTIKEVPALITETLGYFKINAEYIDYYVFHQSNQFIIKHILKKMKIPREKVPITLGENAGMDPIDLLSNLRSRHEKGEKAAGVNVFEGKVEDMKKLNVYDPIVVKKQIIKSATEAASMILKVDDVLASGKMKTPPMPPGGPGGMPMGEY